VQEKSSFLFGENFLPVDQTIDILLDRGELDAAFPPDTAHGVTAGNTSVLDR